MGGSSTSQSAVLSGTKETSYPAFDLRSWQGLTHVLKTGKDSLRDPQAYSEFRNLVLEYAQKGGDVELRKKIDAIVATFGAPKASPRTPEEKVSTPAPVEERKLEVRETASAEKREEKRVFGVVGTRRTPPRFHAPSTRVEPEQKKEREVVVPVAPKPEPVPPIPEPEPVVVPPPVSVPVPEVPRVLEPTPVVASPEPVPASAPAPQVEKAPTPPQTFKTLDEHKARITEIKRLVNAKVGNPATLIDTGNDHGKKYMTALLTALKATGGGGEGVDGAMASLESAYEVLMKDGGAKPEPAEQAVTEAPVDSVQLEEPVPEVLLEPAGEEKVALTPSLEKEKPASVPGSAIELEPKPVPEPVSAREPEEAVIQKSDEKIRSIMANIEREKPPVATTIRELMREEEPVPEVIPAEAGASEETSAIGAGGSWPQSRQVLRGIGRHSPEEVRAETGVDTAQVATKQTELSSPEITATLHQLLHEWSIFHGSGFFGMGPSGSEHPLYQTLAPLSMGEVIAGRWEGGNPKLTKTIKQYVDAWRHEQGIAYVVNETFEHYLRRVVQRIMKRQNSG